MELLRTEAGYTDLVLVKQQDSQMQLSATAEKALITQQGRVQADFDAAAVAAMQAKGMNRGVQRFQIEAEAEDSTYFQLRLLRVQSEDKWWVWGRNAVSGSPGCIPSPLRLRFLLNRYIWS